MLTLVALSSVTGVGSVSSVSADRGVSVAVVDDEEAYLGIEFGDVERVAAERVRQLHVTNQVARNDLTVTAGDDAVTVAPGERATLLVDCDATVTLAAVAPGIEIDATRSVTCSDGPDDGDDGGSDDEDDADDEDEDDADDDEGSDDEDDADGDDGDGAEEDDAGDDESDTDTDDDEDETDER